MYAMRSTLVAGAALLATLAAFGALSTGATFAASEGRTARQSLQADFTRPDVTPLPAEGKFQVVAQSPWQGSKVRVFFLGAQF